MLSNDTLQTEPLELMTNYVSQVVNQIEFDGFPITKGKISGDIDSALSHSKSFGIKVEPK